MRAASVAAMLAVLLWGCGPKDTVAIAFAPRLAEVEGAGAWVEPALHDALADARWLRLEPSSDVLSVPLSIAVGQLRGTDEQAVLRLYAELEPPAQLEARLGPAVDAIVEVEVVDGAIDPVEHGTLALRRAIAVLDAKLGLALVGRDAVTAVLAADDPQIVILGLDFIADHRAREHADDVATMVEHPEDRVRLRALECIGIVGGPEHARLLVQRPRLADRAYSQRMYDALAQLGGDDARGFLEFAAHNEDDPVLAELALQALTRLRGQPDGERQSLEARRGHR